MEFGAIPTVVGSHYRLSTSAKSCDVALAMNISKFLFADLGITLIHTIAGAAVANKVFGGGNHPVRRK